MYTCDVCDKAFKRRDNMLRHKTHSHNEDSEDEDMDSSTSGTDDDISDDTDGDTIEGDKDERYDPWGGVIQKAFDKCDERYQEEVEKLMKRKRLRKSDAGRRVYNDMQSAYRKAIMNIFMNRMTWYDAIRKDPIYKAIKRTATKLVEFDDYDPEEAWKSAVGQRKYLFDTLLENYEPADITTESGDEQDQEMEYSESDEQEEEKDDGISERIFPVKRKYDDFQPVVIGKH